MLALLQPNFAVALASGSFRPAQQLGYPQGDDWEPAVAVDGLHVYAFWMHIGTNPADCSAEAASHMQFQSSNDGGTTWGSPHSIACQAGYQADAQLKVTTLPNGIHRLYASWMDSNQHSSPIFVTYSDDYGTTWHAPVAATKLDHGGSGGDKDILVVKGRSVWVTWEHLETNVVAYTRDIDTTDFTRVSVPNPNGYVSLAYGGGLDSHGNVYFVWGGVHNQGQATGPQIVWLARSSDNGTTWSTSTVDTAAAAPSVTGAGWDFFGSSASLAVIPEPGRATDRLVVVYSKNALDGAPEAVYEKYSDDNGATWLGGTRLSSAPNDAMQGFPAAIADRSGVRVAWIDNRTNSTCTSSSSCGTWNVWYRTSASGAGGWSPETRLDGPAFVALAPHSYQSPAGFAFPYGDYESLGLDSGGHTYAVWGEGPSYAGPGMVWFTRN